MTTKVDSASEAPPAAPAVVRGRDAIRDQIASLIETGQREIGVCAPQLDPHLFNTPRLHRSLAGFVARHRHNRVRLLVEDAGQAVRDNDRIVDLARRLSNFLDVRQFGEQHRGIRELFVLIDHAGYLHQQDLTRLEAVSDAHGVRLAAELRRRFQEMWDRSEPIPELHTAGL
jgi:hypothetical protein